MTSVVFYDLFSRFIHKPDVAVAYVCCEYHRRQQRDLESLFCSLLRQLAERQRTLSEANRHLYSTVHAGNIQYRRPELAAIFDGLLDVARSYAQVFILYDVLDECDSFVGQLLLTKLFKGQQKYPFDLLATSTTLPNIAERFTHCDYLAIHAITDDVEKYLGQHMPRLPRCARNGVNL